jgi:hypothetical protein
MKFTNMKTKITQSINLKTVLLASILIVSPFLSVATTDAAQITGRTVTLSTSAGAATGVTYTLTTAALPSATHVLSVQLQFCTTPTGTCTAPSGFSSASVPTTPVSQPTGLGVASGWTSNEAVTNDLRETIATNATAPSGTVTIPWTNVTNPTATNSSYYAIITTYSDAAWTTPIDSGTVALSTSTQIQVALTVSEALTFCTGTTITGTNCATAAGSTVNLGSGSTTTTATGTSILSASTNAGSGYSITYSAPTTLASGGNQITAISDAASAVGTKQFGLNLVANTTPAVGTAVSGTGTATAVHTAGYYDSANNFTFHTSGDTVASVGAPTNGNTFTVSYIANIDGLTPPGAYTTTLTYTATANF